MSALYTPQILRRALATADYPPLDQPAIRVDGRASPCGSKMVLDLSADADGRIVDVGFTLHACAVGQAAAAIFAASAAGRGQEDLARMTVALERWLTDSDAPAPDWPNISELETVRMHSARHGAALLPFRTALEALTKCAGSDDTGLAA